MGELPKISQSMDAIDHAKKGDLDFFKEAPLDILLNARDSKGFNVLWIVVNGNHVDCCKEICKRCPSLLSQPQPFQGNTSLHEAAYSGYLDILKILISTCDKADLEYQHDIEDKGGDRADQQKTLMLRTSSYGDNAMHKAVHGSQPESIKVLIEADTNKELLRAADHKNNTPLHLAVGLKINRETARLLMEADPDFPYVANSDGQTPLLMAIENANIWRQDYVSEMLKLILELQPTQSMVKYNENGWTALHYCVSRNFVDTIGPIIQSCPQSSKVADNEGQNFFHHVVKSGNVEMVKHILGRKDIITSTVLNSPDNLGRTPWELAAVSKCESMILCLHEDPRVNEKLTVSKNLNWVVETRNFVMMNMFMETNADFLMNIDLEVIQNSVDKEGDTILSKAAQENQLFLCKELYKRCPSLIYHQSKGGRTALHHAAWIGEPEMLKFLIEAGTKSYNQYAKDNIESEGGEKIPQEMLLTMPDDQGDTALHRAVLNHKLKAVKLLVEADPAYKYNANNSGDTPIMISIREARSNDHKFDSGEIRRLLFQMQPRQTVEHRGEKGWTTSLLHHATSEEDLSIIEDIIKFCTGYLDVVDNNGRNFLHIAAELGKIEVMRLVLRAKDIINLTTCLKRLDTESKNCLHIAAEFQKIEFVKMILRVKDIPEDVLNHQDKDGNTPFHIAALTGNEPLTKCFLFDGRINKDTKNKDKQHVLSEIKFPYDKRKARVVGIAPTVDQSDLKDESDFDLVVVALIATVSFTAGITVPGGYISDGPNQGTAVFSETVSFATFIISNTFALVFSFSAVFSHFCARRLTEDAHIIDLLYVAKGCALAAMYCMMVTFIAGSFAVLANSNWLAIVVCIISCLFFIFACGLLWMIVKQRNRAALANQHIQVNTNNEQTMAMSDVEAMGAYVVMT